MLSVLRGSFLLLWLGRDRLGGEERRGLRGRPVEQVARFHEAARIRARPEDDHRDVVGALRQAQHGRQAVAGLGDEPGLPARTSIAAAEQVVGARNVIGRLPPL